MRNLSSRDVALINALQGTFSKKDVREAIERLNLPERSWELFSRKKCFHKYFARIEHGLYIKKVVGAVYNVCPCCGNIMN